MERKIENIQFPRRNVSTNILDGSSAMIEAVTLALKKYGFDVDKIQTFLVSSLESSRVYSLLRRFLYSADSQLAKQLSCLKRFVRAIIAWSDPLNGVTACDVGARRNTARDELIACFLDSIMPYHRLSEICRNLDALGIEANISKSLNLCNSVDRDDGRMNDSSSLTISDCNVNLKVRMSRDRPAVCKRIAESSTANGICRDAAIKHVVRPVVSECRMREQRNQRHLPQSHLRDSSRRQPRGNACCLCTRNANERQSNGSNKFMRVSLNGVKPAQRTQRILGTGASMLKIIVRKMHLADCPPRPIMVRLFSPCKTRDLIQCILEIDPFLGESCLIVMRRKFQLGMRNVCSCLNNSLGKLDAKVARKSRLECNIRPGYISFKLRADGASNADGYLFVARVPICQKISRHMIQQDFAASCQDLRLNVETNIVPRCSEHDARDDDVDNNDTPCTSEQAQSSEQCTCSRQVCFEENSTPNLASRQCTRETEEEEIVCIPIPMHSDLAGCPCDEIRDDLTERPADVTSRDTDDLGQDNEVEERRETLCPVEIDREDRVEECAEHVDPSDESIDHATNGEAARSANDGNYVCLSCDISIEINDPPIDNGESDGMGNRDAVGRCSITSFVQNSDRDKELVELTCNCFLQNDAKCDERGSGVTSIPIDGEVARDRDRSNDDDDDDDFINVTAVKDASKKNVVYVIDALPDVDAIGQPRAGDCFATIEITSRNNFSIASVQTPRLMISSKGINVDISCPRAANRLMPDDDAVGVPDAAAAATKSDSRKEVMSLFTRSLIMLQEQSENRHEIVTADKCDDANGEEAQSHVRSGRFLVQELRSDGLKPERSDVPTSVDERLCAENSVLTHHVASGTSHSCRLITIRSDFDVTTTENNPGEFRKLGKLSERSCECVSLDVDDVTSATKRVTTVTKFRSSIDKSVSRIKRLIRTELRRVLFRESTAGTAMLRKKFLRNRRSLKDARRETAARCVGQNCSVTSCSVCREQGRAVFSRGSSNVLSIRKNWGRTNSEGEMEFYSDRRSSDGSEVLSSFRSMIEISYDFLSSTSGNLARRKSISDNQHRYRKRRNNVKTKQNIVGRENPGQRAFKNYKPDVTVAPATEMSFAEKNYPKYLECCACKCEKKARDKECVCERTRDRRKRKVRLHACTCNRRLHEQVSSEISSSCAYEEKLENVKHEQFYRMFRLKNLKKFLSMRNNWQMVGNKNIFDYYCDDDYRCDFMILIQNYNNYINEIDQDFKLKLSRYVELCRNVKRALIRTL